MAMIDQIALALSDPTRLHILDLLAIGRTQVCCSPNNPETPEAICACDILSSLDIAPSRLSYHIKELREAGLVTEQKRGRWIYYALNREALAEFLRAVENRYLQAPSTSCCTPAVPLQPVEQQEASGPCGNGEDEGR
jgi:ArsR family transcriptional regulator